MLSREWEKNSPKEAIRLREKSFSIKLFDSNGKLNYDKYAEMCNLLLEAAWLGDAEAQFEYYELIRREAIEIGNYSNPEEEERIFDFLHKSASQGYAKAQVTLAVCYKDGDYFVADPQKEFYWYKKAAENGLKEVKLQVAFRYLNGKGTKKA
jgi:TPR repeat protein